MNAEIERETGRGERKREREREMEGGRERETALNIFRSSSSFIMCLEYLHISIIFKVLKNAMCRYTVLSQNRHHKGETKGNHHLQSFHKMD